MVNLVNQLKDTPPEINAHDRIIDSAETRLLPIVLTSITTVADLLPMAYDLGGSDPFSAPMALAMGYGILFATPITLVLIQCLLAVTEDLHALTARLFNRQAPLQG